jgi:hypothetical protein
MNLRNVNWKSAFLASALLAASSVPAAAGNLYNQPYDGSGNMYASQNDTNPGGFGSFATVYDNFTLATAANITGVDWTGGYFNGGQAAIARFTVTFSADNAGVPGGSLASFVITGNANETVLTDPIYTYDAAVAFAAAAGTQYWLSIVPDIGFPPQWGWATGTGGDGNAYQVYFGTGGSIGTDMAFGLSGTTGTPEPVSFSLAGIGLGLVGLASWKRRKQGA